MIGGIIIIICSMIGDINIFFSGKLSWKPYLDSKGSDMTECMCIPINRLSHNVAHMEVCDFWH